LLLPPVTKSPEQLEREKIEFAQQRKDAREGKISSFESLLRATEKVLTLAQLREALKPKYYGDIRYKPVEGAPPAGSAPLPLNRLKKAQAFNVTGVDFAGPLYCKKDPKKQDTDEDYMAEDGSHKLYKCYVCLFTCAVTRAIHLELVPDLSACSFLLAFRRFAARRGRVSVMYSDNAQTFRCVDRHLNILQSDPNIQDLLARRKLLWIYSASLAPWRGGFWERMVRSVKDLLRRTNGRARLFYDEMEVNLIEIESVINARPLGYIGEGADDSLPITPNQFLNNRRSTCATPEPAVNLLAPTSTGQDLVEMDKDRREYVSDVCARFVSNYVMQLDNFQSKGKSGRQIRLNEIVLIHDEDTKRLMWSTGLVTELRKSRDGLIRSVVLRTPNGNYINRAIQCLYPLEVRMDDPEDVAIEDLEGEPGAEADPVPPEPETEADPAPPEPASMETDPNPVDGGVEPTARALVGSMLGMKRLSQQPLLDLAVKPVLLPI
jgi:hypothetical protein